MSDFRQVLKWILATWPRRSHRRNPIEELHAFFAERLTDSGKKLSLLWVVSLALAMAPGWSPAEGLFSLLTSVLLVSLVLAVRSPSLKAKFLSSGRAVEGEQVELRFRLENTSKRALEWVGIGLFRARDGLASRDEITLTESLEAGATCDLTVRVQCQSRGPTGFPGVGVVKPDGFGLARSRKIDFQPLDVEVCPASLAVKPGRFLFDGPSGAAFAEAVGMGADRERIFQGVRPFREGDRLRDLDHKAWARWNIPIVREFASAPNRGIAIAIETGCEGLLERSRIDPMLRLAAGVAADFCRRGWLGSLRIDGVLAKVRLDSVEDVVSAFARVPRCGWGRWPKPTGFLTETEERTPVLVFGVSPRVAFGRDSSLGFVIKRLVVVFRPKDQEIDEEVRQILVSEIALGEIVL